MKKSSDRNEKNKMRSHVCVARPIDSIGECLGLLTNNYKDNKLQIPFFCLIAPPNYGLLRCHDLQPPCVFFYEHQYILAKPFEFFVQGLNLYACR